MAYLNLRNIRLECIKRLYFVLEKVLGG